MSVKIHKMVLALAILTAANTSQAAPVGVLSLESNPGSTPLVRQFSPGGIGNNLPSMAMLEVAGISIYAPMDHVINLLTPLEGGRNDYNSVTLYHLSGRGAGKLPVVGTANGIWTFAEIGNTDVWFGEWNAEQATGPAGVKVAGTHNVFYIGALMGISGKATNLPYANNVNYLIKSINNYAGGPNPVPTSTLTANFISHTASSTGDISFINGVIEPNYSNSAGKLTASNVSVSSAGGTGGNLTGQFFQENAPVVAGIVTFSDRDKNTAFGGMSQ